MTAFEDALDAALGDADDTADIRPIVVPLYEYGFDDTPILIWKGQGRLFTIDGKVWQGSIDAAGNDRHQVPSLTDARDGSAADLQFGFPFIDKATFDAVKALHEPVAGRIITCYLCVILPGEGLRPATPIDFFGQYTMQSPTFSHQAANNNGTLVTTYSITVLAKGGNAGRSRAAGGTYTDTCQQQRAGLLGVSPDDGCGFVASIANETLTFP